MIIIMFASIFISMCISVFMSMGRSISIFVSIIIGIIVSSSAPFPSSRSSANLKAFSSSYS